MADKSRPKVLFFALSAWILCGNTDTTPICAQVAEWTYAPLAHKNIVGWRLAPPAATGDAGSNLT